MRDRDRRAEFEEVLDHLIQGTRIATLGTGGLCLPTCVLLERVLAATHPAYRFAVRLGALHVRSRDSAIDSILFDPRTPDGAEPAPGPLPPNAGFHVWLEDSEGELLDPSILLTLHGHGYHVDPDEYLLGGGRSFESEGVGFVYEELRELELIGVEETEGYLARAISFVLTGQGNPSRLGPNVLDLAWRSR